MLLDDYHNGYMDLLFEFSNYKKEISFEEFTAYINNRENIRIYVVLDENRIIGAGTKPAKRATVGHRRWPLRLNKLHNKSVGQIEDVIITESFRGMGIGKKNN